MLQNGIYKYGIFSKATIFKPENCVILDSFRENPYNFGRVEIKATIFFKY